MNLIVCTTTDDVYISIEHHYCTEKVKKRKTYNICSMQKVNYAMRSHPTESGVMWTAWNSAEDATCYHDSLAAGVPSCAGIDLKTAASASIAKTLLRTAVGPKCALIEKHWPIPTQSGAGHKKLNTKCAQNKTINKAKPTNTAQNNTINKAKPTGYKKSENGVLVYGRDVVANTKTYEFQNNRYGKTLYEAVHFCYNAAIGARADDSMVNHPDILDGYTNIITDCEKII